MWALLPAPFTNSSRLAMERRMQNENSVSIGRADINGVPAHTVRIIERGELLIKALCNSRTEALRLAKLEGERLGVDVNQATRLG